MTIAKGADQAQERERNRRKTKIDKKIRQNRKNKIHIVVIYLTGTFGIYR